MAIVAGFDVHRAQITFDALDTETGEIQRGRMRADPEAVCAWVAGCAGEQVDVAVEACTGWLFVCEALAAAGAVAHLAEPAETSALRGKKRRAKTDRADARWLRTLLGEGRLPEAWIPPAHVREWRTRTRLRKTLVDERTSWVQRIQATLFHHGIANVPDQLLRANGRAFLRALELPPAAGERIEIALAIIDEIDRQLIAARARARAPRAAPAGLSGADAPVRDRAADGDDDPGRARRRVALVGLAQGRALLRAWTSACTAPIAARAPAGSPAKAHRSCAGRSTRPPSPRASPPAPTTPTTSR